MSLLLGAQPASPVLQLAGGGHLRVVRHITTEELRRGGITKLLVANRGEIAVSPPRLGSSGGAASPSPSLVAAAP
ncbi:hypothetical protein HaLaN_30508 [Haematococcus lacustris]|uniref:Uncharacterized protein n=1 Tax=Haematococcus lacustris TaxID=44745 RepID=A0A6A0AFM0_HAELA|nr:hypothetical protein HaLaN_30508 [Haematococcus lacustris]